MAAKQTKKATTKQASATTDRNPGPVGPDFGGPGAISVLFGVLVLVVATTGLVLDHATPWLFQSDPDSLFDERESVHRSDLLPGAGAVPGDPDEANAYLKSLTLWPLLAWMGAMVAGGLLVIAGLAANVRPMANHAVGALLVVLAFLGGVMLIAKLRLLGWIWAPLYYGESPIVHPHVASYFQIAGGLLFLAGALYLLRPILGEWFGDRSLLLLRDPLRVPAWTLAGVLVALMLFPIFPYAGTETGLTPPEAPLTEFHLAGIAEGTGEAADAAASLAWVRGALWAAFLVALVASTATVLDRAPGRVAGIGRRFQHAQVLALVPLLIAFAHSVVFFVSLGRVIETFPVFNYFPVIMPAALIALTGWHYVRVTLRDDSLTRPEPSSPPAASAGKDVGAEDFEEIDIDSASSTRARRKSRGSRS